MSCNAEGETGYVSLNVVSMRLREKGQLACTARLVGRRRNIVENESSGGVAMDDYSLAGGRWARSQDERLGKEERARSG